jgi:hypothetical protein
VTIPPARQQGLRTCHCIAFGPTTVAPSRNAGHQRSPTTYAHSPAQRLLLDQVGATVLAADKAIEGFNVGMNCGETAGQTIMHCHVHLIPRRPGDVDQPRGGVRAVIPGKAAY